VVNAIPPQDQTWDDLLGAEPDPIEVLEQVRERMGLERRSAYVRPHGLPDDERGVAARATAQELREQLGLG
jgi:hypothetical protein